MISQDGWVAREPSIEPKSDKWVYPILCYHYRFRPDRRPLHTRRYPELMQTPPEPDCDPLYPPILLLSLLYEWSLQKNDHAISVVQAGHLVEHSALLIQLSRSMLMNRKRNIGVQTTAFNASEDQLPDNSFRESATKFVGLTFPPLFLSLPKVSSEQLYSNYARSYSACARAYVQLRQADSSSKVYEFATYTQKFVAAIQEAHKRTEHI
jgi:hypothetical protein